MKNRKRLYDVILGESKKEKGKSCALNTLSFQKFAEHITELLKIRVLNKLSFDSISKFGLGFHTA